MNEGARYRCNAPAVVGQVIDDEAVIMNLAKGLYYSLRGSGAAAWALLDAGCDLQESASALAATYGIPIQTTTDDVRSVITRLLDEGLIVVAPERTASASQPALDAFAKTAYAALSLETYSDMQELLALDPPMPELTVRPKGGAGPV